MKRPTIGAIILVAALSTAQAEPPAGPVPAGEAGISLNFQNTDIDGVLRFFGEITGNIFIRSEAAQGYLTVIAPGPVGREEALDVLRAALAVRGIVLVPGPGKIVRVLTQAEAVQTDLRVATATTPSEGMVTRIVPLKFLAATDIRQELLPLLSRNGNLMTDARSNAFVITDHAPVIERLVQILAGLDVRSPQVLIEALMVEISLTAETKLGLEWSRAGRFRYGEKEYSDQASANFGLGSFITEGLRYSVVRSDGQLSGLIQMLATDKNVNILSTPHIIAVNNQPALIRVGEEVPVLTQTRNIQGGETIRSFDFKQVAIELEVTPRINPDGDVFLKVHPLVKKILGFNAELNAPILATREAQTSVQVRDGETVVIGGLMKDDRSSSRSKIPILGDIPLLGMLFRKSGNTREKTELLVFITPRIMTTPEQAQEVTRRTEERAARRSGRRWRALRKRGR